MAKKTLSPDHILDLSWSFAVTRTLITAVELQLFGHIDRGKDTVPQLARATRASRRGIRMLADALVGMGLVKRRRGGYRLTPESARFLVAGKPTYIGDMVQHTGVLWTSWEHLTEAVRQGGPPVEGLRREDEQAAFFALLVKSIFNSSYRKGKLAAARLHEQGYRYRRILDVAAGSAGWSIPFAQLNRQAQVTALDFPEVLEVTREFVAQHGLESQFQYIPGNLRRVRFGTSRYDLIILGNICHSEGQTATRKLFRKCFRALEPGGHLLIAETLPNDRRTGPRFPLLFALNMLMHTPSGDVFTLREYREWLKQAGFRRSVTLDVQSHSPLILALKRRR